MSTDTETDKELTPDAEDVRESIRNLITEHYHKEDGNN